jgi:hypothetical protein
MDALPCARVLALKSVLWLKWSSLRDDDQHTHLAPTYHTIPYHTLPYHTIPHHATPNHTIPHQDTIPHHTTPYHTIPYHTMPYHTMPQPPTPKPQPPTPNPQPPTPNPQHPTPNTQPPTPIYRWGAFSPEVASDFTVVPGAESGAAKLLGRVCRKPRPEDMVHIVSYFQRELPGALCTHLDNLLKEKDEEVMVWLRWCAPKVKEMYSGR